MLGLFSTRAFRIYGLITFHCGDMKEHYFFVS